MRGGWGRCTRGKGSAVATSSLACGLSGGSPQARLLVATGKARDARMARLSGKRCLIVGGTGGLGLAAARRFVEEGARLVLAGLAPADEPAPGSAPFVACDATDAAQVEALFHQTVALLGGLDVLFHVAGASGRRHGDGPLHECSDAGWQATLDVNLRSTFLTNRAAVR